MSDVLRRRIQASIDDGNLQAALDNNAQRRKAGRLAAFALVPDLAERRARAHAVKADVVARLEEYVDLFAARVGANGIVVHRAKDSAEAVRLVRDIVARARGNSGRAGDAAPLVAKAKSMVSEEINLNHALAAQVGELGGRRPARVGNGRHGAHHLPACAAGGLVFPKQAEGIVPHARIPAISPRRRSP